MGVPSIKDIVLTPLGIPGWLIVMGMRWFLGWDNEHYEP
jgi:hypothetical protein